MKDKGSVPLDRVISAGADDCKLLESAVFYQIFADRLAQNNHCAQAFDCLIGVEIKSPVCFGEIHDWVRLGLMHKLDFLTDHIVRAGQHLVVFALRVALGVVKLKDTVAYVNSRYAL